MTDERWEEMFAEASPTSRLAMLTTRLVKQSPESIIASRIHELAFDIAREWGFLEGALSQLQSEHRTTQDQLTLADRFIDRHLVARRIQQPPPPPPAPDAPSTMAHSRRRRNLLIWGNP